MLCKDTIRIVVLALGIATAGYVEARGEGTDTACRYGLTAFHTG